MEGEGDSEGELLLDELEIERDSKRAAVALTLLSLIPTRSLGDETDETEDAVRVANQPG